MCPRSHGREWCGRVLGRQSGSSARLCADFQLVPRLLLQPEQGGRGPVPAPHCVPGHSGAPDPLGLGGGLGALLFLSAFSFLSLPLGYSLQLPLPSCLDAYGELGALWCYREQ